MRLAKYGIIITGLSPSLGLLSGFFSRPTCHGVGVAFQNYSYHRGDIHAVSNGAVEDRLGASDFMEGGTTVEDSKIAAQEFEKAGINVLDIPGGFSGYTVPGLAGEGHGKP